jgi:hypothetical protein
MHEMARRPCRFDRIARGVGALVMESKMLRGIKVRAESLDRQRSAESGV